MYFNGFTLLLVLVAAFVGFLAGVRYENKYLVDRLRNADPGETIEEQMKRDGWRI